jgi:2-haloacid dehalogenase
MATMDSISTWSAAADGAETGLAWRDRVTERMIQIGRYVPYVELVRAAAAELQLPRGAEDRLVDAWQAMEPWPEATALRGLAVPFAFVTNCSTELARVAEGRSGLTPRFTLSAEEAGWYKPRPEIYRQAVERLGIPPDRVRFVAGAAYDARGALDAGLDAVLVRRRVTHETLPPKVRVVGSLHEALTDA